MSLERYSAARLTSSLRMTTASPVIGASSGRDGMNALRSGGGVEPMEPSLTLICRLAAADAPERLASVGARAKECRLRHSGGSFVQLWRSSHMARTLIGALAALSAVFAPLAAHAEGTKTESVKIG